MSIDTPPVLPLVAVQILSWAPEVIADSSGEWSRNALRFATEREAYDWAVDLSERWTVVREVRAAPSTDYVTHRYEHGKLEEVMCGNR